MSRTPPGKGFRVGVHLPQMLGAQYPLLNTGRNVMQRGASSGPLGPSNFQPRLEGDDLMGKNGKRNGLADPSHLEPLDEDERTIQVVIETPKGSRNKYAFNTEDRVFELKKVLPAGMTFPYDFGFVPSTKADDGDPVDVLVLMDEPAFPGCLLKCRLIGVIEGEQGKKKESERNDRIVAIEQDN